MKKMLKFKEFIREFNLKNKATSNIEIQNVLERIVIKCGDTIGISMRDDKFTTPIGIVNLHPTKGTHWVLYINQFYFDSYGIIPPLSIQKYIKNIIKLNLFRV